MSEEKLDEATLRHLYVERRLSMRDIEDETGHSDTTVYRRLKECGIETRDRTAALTTASRRKPASFKTVPRGHEMWRTKTSEETKGVFVHRLLAVAEFGFEAVRDNIVHHGKEEGKLPACEIPWANWGKNLELMTASQHSNHHNPGLLTDVEKIRVAELYRNGDVFQRELGEMFGVSRQTIGGALRDMREAGEGFTQ